MLRLTSSLAPRARAAGMSTVPFDRLFNPTEEHAALRESVRAFTENEVEPQAIEFNRAEQFNQPLFKALGDLGALGVTVDEEYGGLGMDATAATIIHEELSASDPAFCLSYLAHSMLFTNNLNQNGNHEQKMRFLPDASSGARIGGMCMSEPGAGTDVLGMRTTAVKDGDSHWRLSGQKMWITNGCVSDTELGDMFLVYAKTGEGLSLFLVEKGMEGFSLGTKIKDKLGMRASATAELVFEDVRIPAENLVGEENGAVICMMRNLEVERLTLAAMACGIARRCLTVMNDYAGERKAFGSPLNKFGQVQTHIGTSYAAYMAGKSYTYAMSQALDLSRPGNRIDSDGVKLFCAPMATKVADTAIQVLGGNGYTGEYNVERLWRDAKLLEIGGGTNEAHTKNMAGDLARNGF